MSVCNVYVCCNANITNVIAAHFAYMSLSLLKN